eukprot:scaffold35297_cov63-Phaeocystis_antarctica.AAC.1
MPACEHVRRPGTVTATLIRRGINKSATPRKRLPRTRAAQHLQGTLGRPASSCLQLLGEQDRGRLAGEPAREVVVGAPPLSLLHRRQRQHLHRFVGREHVGATRLGLLELQLEVVLPPPRAPDLADPLLEVGHQAEEAREVCARDREAAHGRGGAH